GIPGPPLAHRGRAGGAEDGCRARAGADRDLGHARRAVRAPAGEPGAVDVVGRLEPGPAVAGAGRVSRARHGAGCGASLMPRLCCAGEVLGRTLGLMTKLPTSISAMVSPSGGDFATKSAPMLPDAPALFSTVTG